MRLQGMATVKRSPGKEIPLSQATTRIKGRLIVYRRNGRLIVASWPRKRTTPYTEEELAQRAEFKALAFATKYIDADTAVAAREIAAHSKHTWRDIVSRMMTGTLVELETLVPSCPNTTSTFLQKCPVASSTVTYQHGKALIQALKRRF